MYKKWIVGCLLVMAGAIFLSTTSEAKSIRPPVGDLPVPPEEVRPIDLSMGPGIPLYEPKDIAFAGRTGRMSTDESEVSMNNGGSIAKPIQPLTKEEEAKEVSMGGDYRCDPRGICDHPRPRAGVEEFALGNPPRGPNKPLDEQEQAMGINTGGKLDTDGIDIAFAGRTGRMSVEEEEAAKDVSLGNPPRGPNKPLDEQEQAMGINTGGKLDYEGAEQAMGPRRPLAFPDDTEVSMGAPC
jgi:hypothetical protein